MNHINEEILNKYIDNELSGKELSDLNEHIKICDKCLNTLKAHKLADTHLRKMEVHNPSADFTERLMQKVHLTVRPFKPRKSYFIRFIFSTILLCSLAVVIVAFANLPVNSDQGISYNEYIVEEVTNFFTEYKKILTGTNASIIGAVLSFSLLISAYFIYESHKSFKNRLDKLR